jgi:cellobiose-specific phosphotransferase system component IIC
MKDVEEILVDNLKEVLSSAQKYLLAGMAAALFILLLVIEGKFNKAKEDIVEIPALGISAPTSSAAFVALGIYFFSGIIVCSLDKSCRRIEAQLQQSKSVGLLDAVLTYPSIIRTSKLIGVGGAFLTFGLGASALSATWLAGRGIITSLLTAVLFSSPYLVLGVRLARQHKRSK